MTEGERSKHLLVRRRNARSSGDEEGGHAHKMFAVVDIFNRNSPQVNITSVGHITHEVNITVATPQYHLSCTARQIKKEPEALFLSKTLCTDSDNTYRSGNQVGDSFKASRWHTLKFA